MEWRPFLRVRVGPRSITSKLLVSLLLVSMVSVAAIGVVFWSHARVRTSMRELTDVADPLDSAAHEMEINAIGSGLAVAQYLHTGDAAQRVRLDDDEGDFLRANRRYQRLADTSDERYLGAHLQRDYDDFNALGRRMIELRDRQQRDSRQAFSSVTALHFDLERGLRMDDSLDPLASEDERAMQASLGQLVSQLGAYIANGDRTRPRLVRSELRVLGARLAELRSRPARLSERAVRGRIAARLGVIRPAVGRVLRQEARLTDDTRRFNVLRELDAILDGRVQVLARERVVQADRRADDSFSAAEHAWIALGVLFVLLTFGALALLARAIGRPMSRLTAGTAAVAAGDLNHRIEGLDGDEFGLLAGHFNMMVEKLQKTLVSKEALQRSEAELRQMTARLAEEASTDALTALANRREFERCLDEAIADAAGGGREHVLCYLDLDQFKIINDTCGHAAGDELLRRVAIVLLARLRPDDTVARLGGDEFGVILRDCSVSDGKNVAEQLREDLHRLRFAWDDNVFTITVSIGLVPVLATGGDSQEALKAADAACYAAKDRGRNRVQLYGPDDGDLLERQSQMQSIPRLTGALEADRFELDFQPIVPLASDAADPAHYEVLVRMLDEAGNRVPPGAFIPAAERYGLMPRIDRWVVRAALAHVASRREANGPEVCAINLSGTSLAAPDMLEYIEEQLACSGVAPDAICFEITETAAMTDLAAAMRFIERLKTIGCRFALDDFGSGMSSFAYLKHLPVDYLKIDGDFVRDIGRDPVAAALVESINNVGHIVGARTVAECVEDDATLKQLTAMGVDFGQGFGIARPRLLVSGEPRFERPAADAPVVVGQ